MQNRITDIDNLEKVGRRIRNDNRYNSVKIAFALLRLDKIKEINTDNSNLELGGEKKEYYTFLYGLIVPKMGTESDIEVKIDKDEFKIIKGRCKIQKIAQLLESLDQKKETNFNGYKIVYDPRINESKFYSSDDKRLRIEEKYPCRHLRFGFRNADVFPRNQGNPISTGDRPGPFNLHLNDPPYHNLYDATEDLIPTFEAKSGYYGNIEVFLPEYGPRIIGDLKKDKREGKITVETDYKYEHVDSKPVVSVIAGEKPYFREKKECNGHNLTFKLKEYEEPIAVYLSCRGKIVDKRICRKKWEEFSIQRILEKLPKNKEGIMLKAAITRHALEKAVKEKLKENGITFDEKDDFYSLTKRLRAEGIIGQYECQTLKRNYSILNDPTHAKPSFNEDLVIKTITDSVSWLKSEIWEE